MRIKVLLLNSSAETKSVSNKIRHFRINFLTNKTHQWNKQRGQQSSYIELVLNCRGCV